MGNNYHNYKYIYPPNARQQEQLDIMIDMESQDKDPMDPKYIDQEILFATDYWHVSYNRFPYDGAEKQFLIVAEQPVYKLEEMSAEMWDDLRKIWLKLKDEYGLDGGGICMRFGNPAKSGASLTRLHAHIIMPEKDAKVKFGIGGRTELKEELTIRSLEELKES